MKNVTKLAKKSAGLSQKCSICPLMKRCTLEIQRACVANFVACTLKKNTVTLLFAKAATTNYQKKKRKIIN